MAFQTKMVNLNVLRTVKLFIMVWSVFSVLVNTSRCQDAPHCSSTFHVWQPGHEAQQMIREMFLKMDNLTSYTKYEIAELRTHLTEEASRLQNWTHSVDKRVFQIQIDKMDDELLQMKLSAGSSKVQMQLEHINRRVDDLEKSMYSIRSKLRSGRSSIDVAEDNHGHHYNIPQQQGLNEDVAAFLKNSVGDLKAEWILLKRDIESLKKESINHMESLEMTQNNTANLKVIFDKTKQETKTLEMKVYGIADKQDRLEVKMERVLAECEQINFLLDQYKADVHQYGANVETLKSTSVSLRNELNDVHIKLSTMKDSTWNHHKLRDGTPSESMIIHHAPEHSQNLERSLAENSKERSFTSSREEFSSETQRDCHDIYLAGFKVSSVYYIQPDGARNAVSVYCEMINNTGYTLIQRRIDGTLSFNRRWSEYQQGFGNPYGEIWAGNEWIHLLTKQKQYTLRIDFWDWEGGQYFAEYARFYVESENEQYRLTVSEYTGNAGDSFGYHNKMAFSTEDMDNDLHERHCAAENKAGWWYNSCFYCQLNGIYHTAWYSSQSKYADGIVWFTLKDDEFYSLKKVEMKLKPNKAAG